MPKSPPSPSRRICIVAKLSLDGLEVQAEVGAPLVEAIKQNGSFISNLCYVDGIPAYAGCRTCLVEIEGARGLQLACTSRVAEGMVVRTKTDEVLEARQAVLSIINANHSDRCLTCHRRVHCQPGDICLRDDNVTHRCLTCAKNYRCELQTTNELLQMANYEPWQGEARTFYEAEQPEADRANPFLEFDPQMCILCTRCVRVCDEVRHTGALTLAGRGSETRIAFGAGGAVEESNCDFCGSCIDACPTATLLEKPNKWIAKTETWISTTCNSCSVGCTLSMGVRNGKVVMVKPDRLNPVSDDQICVRGRFHYDALKPRDRLTRHLVRSGDIRMPSTLDTAVEAAASSLAEVTKQHGAASVGFLIGPWATNEEAFAAQKLARGLIGTENIDSTAGPLARAVSAGVAGAFGSDILTSDLADIAKASTIVVIADDLESSHNIAALRVKDAVVQNDARLVVISSRYGELCDFIAPPPAGSIMPSPQRVRSAEPGGVWLRPHAGGESATLTAICNELGSRLRTTAEGADEMFAASQGDTGVNEADIEAAIAILSDDLTSDNDLAIIYAPNAVSASLAGEISKAAANLAVLCRGEAGAACLQVLPSEANVNGIIDMGASPRTTGKTIDAMLDGGVRALVTVGDNPIMHMAGQTEVSSALDALDCLISIDSLPTDTVEKAHVSFAELPAQGKSGTYTSADRRLLRLTEGESATGDQRSSLEILAALAASLGEKLGAAYTSPGTTAQAVMDEVSAAVAGYGQAGYAALQSGVTKAHPESGGGKKQARLQAVVAPVLPPSSDGLILTSARTLYTSLDGASIHSEEADKLHREEFLEINPVDAIALKIEQNHPVTISRGDRELSLPAALTDAVAPGSVFLPRYFDGGVVNQLLDRQDEMLVTVNVRPV